MSQARAASERVLVALAPAKRSILLRAFRPLAWSIALGIGCVLAAKWPYAPGAAIAKYGPGVASALGGLALGWQVLVYRSRRYGLTDQRLVATRGVFHRTVVEMPLTRVQQVVVDRTVGERLMGLGTLCVTSAGSQTIDLAWVMIAQPDARAAEIRAAMAAVGVMGTPAPGRGPRVIGLAGGIGAGKSAVAAELAKLGYIVLDSDRMAKEALDTPAVRGEIVGWWGPRVLTPEGRVDRSAVAKIIFGSDVERRRLEALVHPIVKADRATMVERARAEGAPGVVVDAPLLFEAGSDAECDVVVFVDAPRADRLARVKAGRGWDEAELARREKAQLPLEEKRRRSDVVIVNDAGPGELQARVARALAQLTEGAPAPES